MSEQIPHRRQRCPALTRLCLLGTLLLAVGVAAFAQEQRPLRFAVIEGWAMPMMQFVDGQTTTGILYDLYMHLAQKVGRDAELVVIPRLRAQSARARGEIDVHCYVNPSWHQDSHHQYIWSQPLLVQHGLIVGRSAEPDFGLPWTRTMECQRWSQMPTLGRLGLDSGGLSFDGYIAVASNPGTSHIAT